MNQLSQKFKAYILQSPDNQIRKDLEGLYHNTESFAKLLEQIDDLKKCLDSLRPLSKIQLDALEKALSVEFTYHSNRIEGNTLTLSETAIVIQEGMTIRGNSLREHNEAISHDYAYQYIKKIVEQKQELTENVICTIHETILKNIIPEEAGVYRHLAASINETAHIPPDYWEVPELMEEMLNYYELNKEVVHPVLLATYMHERILSIHPFADGNGRTARLVFNLILLANGFPITIVKGDKRAIKSYYFALKQAQIEQNMKYFKLLMGRNVKRALIEYLNLLAASELESDKGEYLIRKILKT